MQMPIDDIRVGDRYRSDMGDLQALADSIAKQGLLQPIGVTEDGMLVFGERRLRACRDVLGLAEVEVRIVNVTSIIEGEHDENEVRKDFTVSERVAIADAVMAELGRRQGQRTDRHTHNCAEVPSGETRKIAAKQSGIGSHATYERAKSVIIDAIPELVGKMDDEEISISAAATIASQPHEVQAEVIQLDRMSRNKAVKQIREQGRYSLNDPDLARKMRQDVVDKVQGVSRGFHTVHDTGMSAHEFMRDALPHTQQQLALIAPALIRFLDTFTKEMANDQSATG